ncbi:hypothetical protein ABW19_dt0207612 [Dactylella cylindrospora]|nr:hypothetical protein ABW19_dt0207612 [Dactylella cylindrospora]
MPPRGLHQRPSGATRRRVERIEKPERAKSAELPIHPSHISELRAFHTKYPPQNLATLLKETIDELREASKGLAENRRTYIFEPDKPRDEDTEQLVANLGKKVEKNVRGLMDLDNELQDMKTILGDVSTVGGEKGGLQPYTEFERQTREARRAYRKRDLKDRYGNVADYVDYRAVIHAVSDPTAPQPQRKDWFRKPLFISEATAEITDEEQLSDSDGEAHEEEDVQMLDAADMSDDDIQEMAATRNLKCPITMQRFVEPVKSSSCSHVFEKKAMLDMIKQCKKLKKPTICPTTGCGREINEKDLKEDLVMKSLVAAEIRKEEREAELAMMEMDDEEGGRRRKSKSIGKGKQLSDEYKEQQREYIKSQGSGGRRPKPEPEDEDEEEEEEEEEEEDESPRVGRVKTTSRPSAREEAEIPLDDEIPYGDEGEDGESEDVEDEEEEEEDEED